LGGKSPHQGEFFCDKRLTSGCTGRFAPVSFYVDLLCEAMKQTSKTIRYLLYLDFEKAASIWSHLAY
jgi:hypothetical protein